MSRYVGRSITPPESADFLQGSRDYIADVDHPLLAGMAEVVFVRSPLAHARILSVDTTDAAAMPGVLGIVTAADHDIFPPHSMFPSFYDAQYAMPILAEGKVRFVGEPVAAVVAETRTQAVDAAELVDVDYELLDAVIDVNDARRDEVLLYGPGEAARLRTPIAPTHGPTNTVLVHDDPHHPERFDREIVLEARFSNPRQVPAPIEPHGQICAWTDDGELHVWAATQRPHGFRDQLADLYRIDPGRIHVTAPAVGGGFGGKVSRTQEEQALPLVARHVGRPVRWLQTRSEYFQGATQGRGEQIDLVLAGDRTGRVRALRGDMVKDAGAYPSAGGNLPPRFNAPSASGPYDIEHVEFGAVSVVTNAPQISAFRGAGRAPYLAALERLLDMYASRIGMDPADVRRRNLVRREQMPFTAVTGAVYDEADYVGDLDRALEHAGYEELRREQQDRRRTETPRQIGIGLATYHLLTVGGGSEEARVRLDADGGATVFTGTTSQGHGHDATWAQLAADELGMPITAIRVLEGSTDHTATGVGAVGSRSMQTAGVAVTKASRAVVEEARRRAAELLEADVGDIEFSVDRSEQTPRARFHVAGVPSVTIDWRDIGRTLAGEDADELVCGEIHHVGDANSFPSGCHVAVVEVDIDTGAVVLRQFFGVDDAGTRVNPMIVEGQLHGGIAQGVGQVLGETMSYDSDGNPLTTSFADYMVPSTDQLPMFDLIPSATPTSFNELGAKGVGESSIIGAVPAVHNAIVDAVAHLGVEHIELPCTPPRVWAAIQEASG